MSGLLSRSLFDPVMKLLNTAAQTTLNGTITALATSLIVTSSATLTAPFRIWMNQEMIIVRTRVGNIYSNLIRGAEGTTAAQHSSGATVLFPLVGAGQPNQGIKAGVIYEILTGALVGPGPHASTHEPGGSDVVELPAAITFIIDGGGGVISTGISGDVEVPFNCTIDRVTMLADQTGSIVVDIWKDSYGNFAPTGADSITASAKPTISSGIKSQDTTLTGWSKNLLAGDILRFNVDSVTSITRLTLSLKVTRT